jgi:hypothetical protein
VHPEDGHGRPPSARARDVGRHAAGDGRHGGDEIGPLAREAVDHGGAVRQAGRENPSAVDAELGDERVDQPREEREVVGKDDAWRAPEPAVVPAPRIAERLRVRDNGSVALRERVEPAVRAPLHPRAPAAQAVQHEHERAPGLRVTRRVQQIGARDAVDDEPSFDRAAQRSRRDVAPRRRDADVDDDGHAERAQPAGHPHPCLHSTARD